MAVSEASSPGSHSPEVARSEARSVAARGTTAGGSGIARDRPEDEEQSSATFRSATAAEISQDFARVEAARSGENLARPRDVRSEADQLLLAQFAPPGVIVGEDLDVVQFRGIVIPYIELPPGPASLNLMRLLRPDLRALVQQALTRARRTERKAVYETADTRVSVIPLGESSSPRYFLVLFEQPPEPISSARAPRASSELADGRAGEPVPARTQSYQDKLRTSIDELRLVNQQLSRRNLDSARLADDLSNVLGSVAIPIVILDRDSRVRRFTTPAGTLFRLLPGDVGRPIGQLRSRLQVPDLSSLIANVLEHGCVVERTIQDEAGHWYQLVVRPYLTTDARIDGSTLIAFDIDAPKQAQRELSRARLYAESVLDTVADCLLVVDRELCVRSANRAFYETFRVTKEQAEGRRFVLPSKNKSGAASLAKRFSALAEGETFQDVRETLEFGNDGERTFSLSGRHIESTPWFLLALRDISEQVAAERLKHKREVEFQAVLETAAEGVLMTDEGGRILFANRMAVSLFGYPRDEMVGLAIDALLPNQHHFVHRQRRKEYPTTPTAHVFGASCALDGRRKDGSLFPAEVLLNIVHREEGALVVRFVTDISARREAEKRLLDSQERLQQLAFERAVAEERERRRIARDLHDRIGQALALAQIKLTGIRPQLPDASGAAVDDAVRLLAQSVIDTRTLTFDLSPPVLYDLGLKAALTWLAEQIEKEHGVHVEVLDDGRDVPLEEAALALVFRAVRELLVNVVKHAKSTRARATLSRSKSHFEVCVEDFGVGFEPSPGTPRGYGLFSVREQLRPLGGSLGLDSAPQKGTRVQLRIPLRIGGDGPSSTRKPAP